MRRPSIAFGALGAPGECGEPGGPGADLPREAVGRMFLPVRPLIFAGERRTDDGKLLSIRNIPRN